MREKRAVMGVERLTRTLTERRGVPHLIALSPVIVLILHFPSARRTAKHPAPPAAAMKVTRPPARPLTLTAKMRGPRAVCQTPTFNHRRRRPV